MSDRIARVALAQMTPRLGDVAANLQTAEDLAAQAAAGGADLVVFPEMCFSGYQLELMGEEMLRLGALWQERIDGTLARIARSSGVNLIAGLCEKEGDAFFNAAYLYGRQGERIGRYRKIFAFGSEGRFFSGGTGLPVFDTDFGRVGILICYDAGFPEIARRLSLAGAEILVIPAAWRIQELRAWELDVAVRALENQVYSVGVNQAGQYGDLRLFGRSLVCGTLGEILLQLPDDRQALGFCDLDLGVLSGMHQRPGYRYDLERSDVIQDPRRDPCRGFFDCKK